MRPCIEIVSRLINWIVVAVSPSMLFADDVSHASDHATSATSSQIARIEIVDQSFVELIDPDTTIEVIGKDHRWTEGPAWNKSENYLLFSDIPRNRIYRWRADEGETIFLEPSGYEGVSTENEPGSNGLWYPGDGNLLVCDHGHRRVYRLNRELQKTTVIDRFEGKRFNSPNDLVTNRQGEIYFTDPPYGLTDESERELDYCGIYKVGMDGSVTLISKELVRPNGIGLSPDERTLYVAQSHRPDPVYFAFSLDEAGMADGPAQRFFDAASFVDDQSPGMPDGMSIDQSGNLWATGPGGVLVISPTGKLLGRIRFQKATANCCFGGDGSELYVTSSDIVCRIPTKTMGKGF